MNTQIKGEKESKTLEQRISSILLSKLVIENKKGIPYAVKDIVALLKAEEEKARDAEKLWEEYSHFCRYVYIMDKPSFIKAIQSLQQKQ